MTHNEKETLEPPGETLFFHDSPPLELDKVKAAFETWNTEGTAESKRVLVGRFTVDLAHLNDPRLCEGDMRQLHDQRDPLFQATEYITDRLKRIAMWDMSRWKDFGFEDPNVLHGFTAKTKLVIWGGFYRGNDSPQWYRATPYPEIYQRNGRQQQRPPSVSWIAHFGVAGSQVAEGVFRRDDFKDGNLIKGTNVGASKPVPLGSVLRCINFETVHLPPKSTGPRLTVIAGNFLWDDTTSAADDPPDAA
jgi:hypothetical protein